jgi:ribonucleoside-diphosphate reductase alpha chain
MQMSPVSETIWKSKYRYIRENSVQEKDISDTWRRVARAVAIDEPDSDRWEKSFSSVLSEFLFLPGGRVLAGAGTNKQVTLFNCFVSGPIFDSVGSIFDSLKETAVTMQYGGGIGCDFSQLRPAGSPAVRTGSVASGPVPFMHIWDSLCETLLATSTRRGAMMGTLRCDHPDIEAFINAKRRPGALSNFNLSVLITDEFMQAVSDDSEWQLVYPVDVAPSEFDGNNQKDHSESTIGSRDNRYLRARDLWHLIIQTAHATGEPGLLFIDYINRNNNLYYCEDISATNPCGEIPLPPYGACNLGSINLTALVQAPFTDRRKLDRQKLCETVTVAVRFLDNVIDVSQFPLPQQAEQARGTRRIGLGITGLADMLAMLQLNYDSDKGREFAGSVMELIRDTAYEVSVELAREKGAFPFIDNAKYLQAPFIRRLPRKLQIGIAKHGIRNSHLLAIAPAGTISLLADNISSGIEPIFSLQAAREVRDHDLKIQTLVLRDHAFSQWLDTTNETGELPAHFVTADALSARAHLAMQASLQPLVDSAISKTVNLPADATAADVAKVYTDAYSFGLKGCTVFRSGTERGQVLRARDASHCCHVDREAD